MTQLLDFGTVSRRHFHASTKDRTVGWMESVVQQPWLAIGLLSAFVAVALYWRRQHAHASPARGTAAPGSIVYRDAPTVRVNDSQRVDRTRKLVSVKAGESVDVLATAVGMPTRFRITVKDIVAGDDAVHVMVEFGGTQLSCGPLVKEIAFNEFVLPRGTRDEHRSSIFYYHERGDSLEFMRIKLKSADINTGAVELDVMQLHGHWPSSGVDC